ncbi:hypothetical protein EC902281_3166, partial [Escherichia coli 90.2281]
QKLEMMAAKAEANERDPA